MSSFENDFILRAVQQMARLIARVLKLKEKKEYAQAEREVADGYLELFGIDPRFFPMMDAATVAKALGHPERVDSFAELLEEQAALIDLQGEPGRAASLRQRRADLLAASAALY